MKKPYKRSWNDLIKEWEDLTGETEKYKFYTVDHGNGIKTYGYDKLKYAEADIKNTENGCTILARSLDNELFSIKEITKEIYKKKEKMDIKEYQKEAHKLAKYPDFMQLFMKRLIDSQVIKTLEWNPIDYDDEADNAVKEVVANPYFSALGLAGEVGVYCNELKNAMWHNNGVINNECRQDAKKELGNILWYLAECASALDLSLDDIAQVNIGISNML